MNFKLGDLIYSPDFRRGTLGIITKIHDNGSYTIEDCFIFDQMWRVRPEYAWRIATDDDIINAMTQRVRPTKETIGYITVDIDEEYLSIYSECDTLLFDFNNAVKLRDYLNKWIVTKEATDESETKDWY